MVTKSDIALTAARHEGSAPRPNRREWHEDLKGFFTRTLPNLEDNVAVNYVTGQSVTRSTR